ncbi:MAG: hypothetical protein K0S45_3161, partial [Nitrospira sp.]|nr:hypothetical protein [Nitrospira sp.]
MPAPLLVKSEELMRHQTAALDKGRTGS